MFAVLFSVCCSFRPGQGRERSDRRVSS